MRYKLQKKWIEDGMIEIPDDAIILSTENIQPSGFRNAYRRRILYLEKAEVDK